jgi:hypothetical protein
MILKRILTSALLSALAATVFAADAKDEVTKAAKALAEKGNYSWKTTVAVPANSPFTPGPTEGKADKDITYITMSFRDNKTEAYVKGDKAAYTDQNGEWQSAAEANTEGGAGFMGRFIRNIKAPAVQAEEIAKQVKELKREGDAYSGDLTEEGAKTLMRFRGRGGDAPEIKGAKGSAKFWVKDGVLSKFEYKVNGQTKNRNGDDMDIDRTTTTEIKEVGTTKLNVPEPVKKKLA